MVAPERQHPLCSPTFIILCFVQIFSSARAHSTFTESPALPLGTSLGTFHLVNPAAVSAQHDHSPGCSWYMWTPE